MRDDYGGFPDKRHIAEAALEGIARRIKMADDVFVQHRLPKSCETLLVPEFSSDDELLVGDKQLLP